MRPRVLVLIDPAVLEAANRICIGRMRFRQEVTQGAIGATRQVDAYAGFDGNVTSDFWQSVIDETLDIEGEDMAAFFAATTVHWYPADGDLPEFEEALTAHGYNLTPPTPTREDVRQERDRRIIAGKSFDVTGYANPVALAGDDTSKIDLLSLAFRAVKHPTENVNLTGSDGVPHTLTSVQFSELQDNGASFIKSVHEVAGAMIFGLSPFESGIPLNYTSDDYWPR